MIYRRVNSINTIANNTGTNALSVKLPGGDSPPNSINTIVLTPDPIPIHCTNV